MKNEFKKINEFFPYGIFQKKEEKKRKYNEINSFKIYHKKEKRTLDICKNLKSVTKSTEVFSDYMLGYKTITQDFCFKTPENMIYPLRKNFRFLSAASLQDIKSKSRNQKRRPASAIIFGQNNSKAKTFRLKRNEKENKKRTLINKNRYSLSDQFDKSIDLDNDEFVKKKNLDYIINFVKKSEYKKYNNIKSDFNETKLFREGVLTNEELKYELCIYSICLKFRLINNTLENKSKYNYQKIYLQFKYLPIFYLIDFELFKVFISEIIFYENNFCLKSQEEINAICDKYSHYICSYINNINSKKDEISIYKNEFLYPSEYKWFIYNNKEKDNNAIYELKIEFPKIKLNFVEKGTKIKNILKKSLLIQLMQNNFESWDKTVLFELFFIKKIRAIINSLIKANYIYNKQKIDIFPFNLTKSINLDKALKLFISDTGNKISRYYIFNPYKIIASKRRMNYYQEIRLNIIESKILHKFKKAWGTAKTLLKCINIENIKEENNIKINFKFDLLNNISNISDEISKNIEINVKEKKDKNRTLLKINGIDIDLINCTMKRYLINENKLEEKYVEIKQEIADLILEEKNHYRKNNNIIFERMSKYIENILEEKEMNMNIVIKKSNLFEENEKSNKFTQDNNTISIVTENKNKKNLIVTNKEHNKNTVKSSKTLFNNFSSKRRVLSANMKSNNKIRINKNNKNKEVKDSLFLTKNLSNNLVGELFQPESESSEEPSFSSRYKYTKSYTNKSLSMIRNQKDLKKNRMMRYYLFNNDFNLKKLEKILLNIQRKKFEENIHNKY